VSYRTSTPLAADLTEKEWQAQVRELASLLGFTRIYHPLRSRGSAPGWPDLAMIRERLVLVELKTAAKASKLSPAQKEWIRALIEAGVETYVCRPSDWDDLAAVLRARGRVFSGLAFDAHQRLVERTRAEVDA
jgi:predicted peroxiredoxin